MGHYRRALADHLAWTVLRQQSARPSLPLPLFSSPLSPFLSCALTEVFTDDRRTVARPRPSLRYYFSRFYRLRSCCPPPCSETDPQLLFSLDDFWVVRDSFTRQNKDSVENEAKKTCTKMYWISIEDEHWSSSILIFSL